MNVYHKLEQLIGDETRLAHVEGHNVRRAFIGTVAARMLEDGNFAALVERQLDLYCNVPDPRTFVAVCNQPGHLVRVLFGDGLDR